MKKSIIWSLMVFLAAIGLFCLPQHTLSDSNIPPNLENELRQIVVANKKQFDLGAISLALILPGQTKPLVLNIGKTQPDNKIVVTSDHLFQVGSLTKTFTAVLIAQAVKQGQIAMSDTVGQYLPQYLKWKDITIAQLVNQTSGIADYINSPNWWPNLATNTDKIWTPDALLEVAYQYPKMFPAGSDWAYSNTNYILLGKILEKAGQKPVSKLMEELVEAAGLANTYYLPHPYSTAIFNRMVHGFYDQYNQTRIHGSWAQMAGALVSHPKDMVVWFHDLFTEQDKFGLPHEYFLQLVSTQTGKSTKQFDEIGYAFGVFRMNTPQGLIYFTPGLTPGYTSMMVYAPCLNIYFAYSANRAPLRSFHQHMITEILTVLQKEKNLIDSDANEALPEYCDDIQPADEFKFPPM